MGAICRLTKSTSSHMGTTGWRTGTTVSGKTLAAAFAASSRIATLVAVQHPKRGDVSFPPPGAEGTALRKRGPRHRFARSTLFAILELKLLQPPLNLGDGPRFLEQVAQGVPFFLGELDAHVALPKPKRELRWPLLLGPRHEEMPTVPRTRGRPSFEHGVKLGQVGIPGIEITHPAHRSEVNIHTQFRTGIRRERQLQLIGLQLISQDNSSAKIILVVAC